MRIGDLYLRLLAEDAGFEKNVVKAGERAGDKAGQSLGQRLKAALSPQNLATAAFAAASVGVGIFAAGLVGAAKSLMEIERLNAQTDAAIRSTGGAAKVSGDQIEELAESMESLTTIERETVQEGANMLLTFTRVRNEVGKGNDIFNQATEAALNMSVALGTDATSAAMLLGKALNDPVKGMTAMTRAGIQFTAQQKAMIAEMVEAGDLLGAQKIILAELETQFGGSAEAFANTTAGRIQRFENDVGNMFESIIVGATKVADALGSLGDVGVDDESYNTWLDQAGHIQEVNTDIADNAEAEYMRAAAAAGAGVAAMGDAIRLGGPVVAREAGKVAGMFTYEIQKIVDDARAVGEDAVLGLAQGILAKQNDPLLAVEAMQAVFHESLSESELIAKLTGEDTMRMFRQGLRSDIPADRVAAQEALIPVITALNALGPAGRAAAVEMMRQLGLGLTENVPVRAARDAVGMITRIFPQSEPEDPQSPFRGITHWGADIMDTIFGNLDGTDAAASVRRALGGIAGSLLPSMGMPALAGGAVSGTGGITYVLNVGGVAHNFDSRDAFVNALDDLSRFGSEGGLG